MARINYPNDFLNRTVLFQTLKSKHDKDGSKSRLHLFLNEQDINLDDDAEHTTKALEKNNEFADIDRDAEDLTEKRNILITTVNDETRLILQFLKKLYKGNPKELGLWGARVDGSRIVYPVDFLHRVQLYKDIKKRHDELGTKSPLLLFLDHNDIDLNKGSDTVSEAEELHARMQEKKKSAEMFREERDLLFEPVFGHVRAIGQFLKSFFTDQPQKLGHWGYTIDSSPVQPRVRQTNIDPGAVRIIKGAKMGSAITNTGNAALLLHKGTAKGSTPFNLSAGAEFTIMRGWGVMTVENPEMNQDGHIRWKTIYTG